MVLSGFLRHETPGELLHHEHDGKPVHIGENSWCGAGVTILPGVVIGKDVIVGAGSVVTKEFPDNLIIAGDPAKIIRTFEERF